MEEINYVKMAAYLGAAFAIGVGAIGPALGQGAVASKALENMGKYPEMADKIRTTMFIGLALIETLAIYAFIISLLLILFT